MPYVDREMPCSSPLSCYRTSLMWNAENISWLYCASHKRKPGKKWILHLQPNPVPIALPPGWCSCPWQCRDCVQPGDSTRCPQGKVASLQSCFLALPSLHGVILGICMLSFFKGSLKMFFQTPLTSSAVSKSEVQSSWAVKSEALEPSKYG